MIPAMRDLDVQRLLALTKIRSHQLRTRRRLLMGGIAALIAAAVAIPAAVLPGGSTRHGVVVSPGPSTSTVSDAANPLFRVVRQIHLPGNAQVEPSDLLVAGGAIFAHPSGWGSAGTIVRVDPATGKVESLTRIAWLDGVTFADGNLWAAISPPGTPGTVEALDPATLTVVRTVHLAEQISEQVRTSITAAGGLVWVATADGFAAVDPASGAVVRHMGVAPREMKAGSSTAVAAPPDGSILWTAESNTAGGPIAAQVRNPTTGVVLNAGSIDIGAAGINNVAATSSYAWVSYPTGHGGSYVLIHNLSGLPSQRPTGDLTGSSTVSTYMAGARLWVIDPEISKIACADPATGIVLAQANFQASAITNVTSRLLAISSGRDILIAQPTARCSG